MNDIVNYDGVCPICGSADGTVVDVVKIKHGYWIWDGYNYDYPWQCSNCGYFEESHEYYCPNCGAKMDGRREDDGGDD